MSNRKSMKLDLFSDVGSGSFGQDTVYSTPVIKVEEEGALGEKETPISTTSNPKKKSSFHQELNQDDLYFLSNGRHKTIHSLAKETTYKTTIRNHPEYYTEEQYKFYKKRIFQLIKDILNEKSHVSSSMIESLQPFIGDAIHSFEVKDKMDILSATIYGESGEKPPQKSTSITDKTFDFSEHDKVAERMKQSDMDNLLYSFTASETKTVDKAMGVKILKPSIVREKIPERPNINLRDPKLKIKGVKAKGGNKPT